MADWHLSRPHARHHPGANESSTGSGSYSQIGFAPKCVSVQGPLRAIPPGGVSGHPTTKLGGPR
jgi:hypothetical protein